MNEPTRNLPSGVMAIIATLLGGWASIVTARAGGWWWLLFVLLTFFTCSAAYGIFESFQKAPRDAKGNRLKGAE